MIWLTEEGRSRGANEKGKLKTKWAALEALVGDPRRLAVSAADLVARFEKRREAMVVCLIRRICIDLYEALAANEPAA